jgi:hypothetical protein
MLTRRLLTRSSIRSFSTSPIIRRSPALADITPAGVHSFDQKQKEFRERLAEQSKKKEPSQSPSSPHLHEAPPAPASFSYHPEPPTAPSVGTARTSPSNGQLGVGSQQGPVEAAAKEVEPAKKEGKLSSLIYGTKEGREFHEEIEQSFSQVLARGKYVHSIVFHEVKPDKVDEYVELVGNWYPKMAGMEENKVHLVGSWRTEVGDCDTFGTFPPLISKGPFHPPEKLY